TPDASQIEVISGALALAGSKPKRLSKNGKLMPIKQPISTIATMLNDTTNATSGPPRYQPISDTAAAMVRPKAMATTLSRPSSLNQSAIRTSPVASARTISVEDCEPALPPLSTNNGKKNTSTRFAAIMSSK